MSAQRESRGGVVRRNRERTEQASLGQIRRGASGPGFPEAGQRKSDGLFRKIKPCGDSAIRVSQALVDLQAFQRYGYRVPGGSARSQKRDSQPACGSGLALPEVAAQSTPQAGQIEFGNSQTAHPLTFPKCSSARRRARSMAALSSLRWARIVRGGDRKERESILPN